MGTLMAVTMIGVTAAGVVLSTRPHLALALQGWRRNLRGREGKETPRAERREKNEYSEDGEGKGDSGE